MANWERCVVYFVQLVVRGGFGALGGAFVSVAGQVFGHPVDPASGALIGLGVVLLRNAVVQIKF